MDIAIVSFKGGVGKTTTAIHLADWFSQQQREALLVDGDLNRSCLYWVKQGSPHLHCCAETDAGEVWSKYSLHIIDTPARPNLDELKTLARFDLLVIPSVADALSLRTLPEIRDRMTELKANYRVLITQVTPAPSSEGRDAIEFCKSAGIPVFENYIRRLAAFKHAALQGVPVRLVKGRSVGKNRGIANRCYSKVGEEILGVLSHA